MSGDNIYINSENFKIKTFMFFGFEQSHMSWFFSKGQSAFSVTENSDVLLVGEIVSIFNVKLFAVALKQKLKNFI